MAQYVPLPLVAVLHREGVLMLGWLMGYLL